MRAAGHIRASDADREGVAERLRRAAAEGRLLTHELEERLAASLRARTYGELDALVGDLPEGGELTRRRRRPPAWIHPALALAVGIPIALMAIAAVLFVLSGFVLLWLPWMLIAYCALGGGPARRHRARASYRREGARYRVRGPAPW
jgi:hypothetical protein